MKSKKPIPACWTFFLQILDEGQLTAANGRKCSFRHSLVILTSNLGSGAVTQKKEMGFGARDPADKDDDQRQQEQIQKAIRKHVRPEFINRLSAVVQFQTLTKENLVAIVGKILESLNQRLADRNIRLELDPGVIECIVAEGFRPEYGARELERTMDRLIAKPLADAILRGTIQSGQRVHVQLVLGRIVFRGSPEK